MPIQPIPLVLVTNYTNYHRTDELVGFAHNIVTTQQYSSVVDINIDHDDPTLFRVEVKVTNGLTNSFDIVLNAINPNIIQGNYGFNNYARIASYYRTVDIYLYSTSDILPSSNPILRISL